MTENVLTPEQKTKLIQRIRHFRAAIHGGEKPLETFKRTLLWSIEASSTLSMLALTKKSVSGRFETVAQYLDESEAEDPIEE